VGSVSSEEKEMDVQRILLTSDDGFLSQGLRALISELRGHYELAIAATKTQRSGVGGAMSIRGGAWGVAEVDGVEALWVDGFPADAIEAARFIIPTVLIWR